MMVLFQKCMFNFTVIIINLDLLTIIKEYAKTIIQIKTQMPVQEHYFQSALSLMLKDHSKIDTRQIWKETFKHGKYFM